LAASIAPNVIGAVIANWVSFWKWSYEEKLLALGYWQQSYGTPANARPGVEIPVVQYITNI
jgi:hypothetical protein